MGWFDNLNLGGVLGGALGDVEAAALSAVPNGTLQSKSSRRRNRLSARSAFFIGVSMIVEK